MSVKAARLSGRRRGFPWRVDTEILAECEPGKRIAGVVATGRGRKGCPVPPVAARCARSTWGRRLRAGLV
jgi:hypothetical protein